MMIIRGLGILFGLIICYLISLVFKIDFSTLLALVAFIVSIDLTIQKIITNMYMDAILDEMQKGSKDDDSNFKF